VSVDGCADDRRIDPGADILASRDLAGRVELLEERVTALEQLPGRMSALESQIVQLRSEMRAEFSAVRQEMRGLNEETRAEMRTLHGEVLDRIAKISEGSRPGRKRNR
jgi:predicted  nucleic acid-binding Zn-ribbon protein